MPVTRAARLECKPRSVTVTAQSQHRHSTVTEGETGTTSDCKPQSACDTCGHEGEIPENRPESAVITAYGEAATGRIGDELGGCHHPDGGRLELVLRFGIEVGERARVCDPDGWQAAGDGGGPGWRGSWDGGRPSWR